MVLHPLTRDQLTNFCAKPSHALMLLGPVGAGKLYISRYVATQILDLSVDALDQYPYYLEVQTTNSNVPIEAIRNLKAFVQLKTTGTKPIRRVVIIENAETMTTEAQNALLKVLEEPPADTVIILNTTSQHALLPTIISRSVHVQIKKPLQKDVMQHFATEDSTQVKRAYHISGGHMGLMSALLRGEEAHPMMEYIDIAKELLQQTTYERLLRVNEMATKDLQALCEALYSVAHAALIVALEKEQTKLVHHWYGVCSMLHTTQRQLLYKPQAKLLLTHLMVNL